MHAMMCLGNLALSCGRPISRPVAVLADGDWLELAIRRAIETVMRVMLRLQTYMEVLVAGITTLTRLVQLQTTDLQDPTGPSWAQGLLDSLNPLLHEHRSNTTGLCPKGMASFLECRLRCVETCLRREMDQDGDKQKLELLQNITRHALPDIYTTTSQSTLQSSLHSEKTRERTPPRLHSRW